MQKTTKIAFVITKGNWGGAQRYVYDLATSLPKDRYDVLVICGEGNALQEKLAMAGVRVIKLPELKRDINLKGEFLTLMALIRIFRSEKPDIVHLNSSKIGGLGGFAARVARVPKIIFTGHGWAFNEKRPAPQKAAILFFHWLTVVFSTITIAVSEKTKKDIVTMPFIASKIRVIHNGSTPAVLLSQAEARAGLSEKNPDLKTFLSEQATSLWIGTISELHHIKGLDFMIEAIADLQSDLSLPPFIFTIIGEGEERKSLEKMILDKGLSRQIFLLGHVDNARAYLKAFDIATLTSRSEALAYFLIEAGNASLPMIASAVGGIPEVIEQLKSGILIKAGHIKELRDAITFLLKDPEKRTAFGTTLHEKAASEFSLDKMLAETIKVYNGK